MRRRSLLGLAAAGVAAPALVRHARAADVPRFALGLASGQPQPHTVVLWTRLTGEDLPDAVDVVWEVAEDDAFTRIAARGVEPAVLADAHSVHAEPAGLQPDRWYWYRFNALGQRSQAGRTRTAPAAGARVARLDFAIASCQRWDHGHYAAWRHAAQEALDLVLFLGDYIYEYASGRRAVRPVQGGTVRTLADYRQRHAMHKSDLALQAAHAACPWLLVWDDHEVENDYAGLQSQTLAPDFPARRAAAYRAYWEHMPLPRAARPVDGTMRLFGSLDWGQLARVHLLDDRQHRDPQACPLPGRGGNATVQAADCAALADPRRTLLGPAQERWLAGNWSLERPWNLLAQQTLMARFSLEDPAQGGRYRTDGWDGYPAARRRLLATAAERRVPGLVVLGGDVHANHVADLRVDFDDDRGPLVGTEFCSTSISSEGPDQRRLEAARAFNPHVHLSRGDQRGYGRFTLRPGELQARLQVVEDPRDPASAVVTQARFTVAAAEPGARPG